MTSIAELRARLQEDAITEEEINQLRNDQRKGVQTLVRSYDLKMEKKRVLEEMHQMMRQHESRLYKEGYTAICGVDEVGRGPLAGPVTACAVILPPDFKLLGLTDSKKVTKAKRLDYADYIKEHALAYHIASVSANEIDQINILQATKVAMKQAIASLSIKADYLLLDAIKLRLETPQLSLVKGDSKSLSIAASSILAKVWRDEYMENLALRYPEYGFELHAGYGTERHLEALQVYGMTAEHRRSFSPVMEKAGHRYHPSVEGRVD